jgi:exodeoxyribonuclease VII small subunit
VRDGAALMLRAYTLSIMAKKNQAVPKNFEEGMRELETILSDIEQGEMGVEESLTRYERGVFLIQHCRGVLNKAQEQIEAAAQGGPVKAEEPAEENEDNVA